MAHSKPPSNADPRFLAPASSAWLSFGPTVCAEVELALEKEWFVANGIGGYSASTIMGAHTRAEHGLLVVPTQPHHAPSVLLSKVEETLFILDQPYQLSANCFEEMMYPRGFEYLKRFSLSPFPTFTYEVEDFRLEKIIYPLRGENTVVIHYRLISGEEELVRLEVKPLVSFRSADGKLSVRHGPEGELTGGKGRLCFRASAEQPPLYLMHQAAVVDKSGAWYGQVVYPRDEERAEPAAEALYAPCTFIYSFMARDEVLLVASTRAGDLSRSPADVLQAERERAIAVAMHYADAEEKIKQLGLQAEHYLINHAPKQLSITQGYFGGTENSWAAMIAVPGLLIMPGRYEEAFNVLRHSVSFLEKGFLPSGVRPDGTFAYESIDAALWFIEAVFLYAEASENHETVERFFYPLLKRIVKYYERGTHFGVHAAEDGLITQDDRSVPLTWMRAKIKRAPVTLRAGKAVEINALWYNALRIVETLAVKFRDQDTAGAMDRLALKVYESFHAVFWSEKKALLYDCVQGERRDAAIRPNTVFTMSLSFPVLQKKYRGPVLQLITQELFTPFGLRTLSRRSRAYRAKYRGDRIRRAQAEHQGTVWAWLIGPYVRAYLRTYGETCAVKDKLLHLLEPFLNHLSHFGLNAISSCYDGNAPHKARGLVGDVCATAELLRSYFELTNEETVHTTLHRINRAEDGPARASAGGI